MNAATSRSDRFCEMDDAARWSFTMDADGHLSIYRNRTAVFEGSYEAFVADGDVNPPVDLVERIHVRYDALHA